jgi:hypothetical protein
MPRPATPADTTNAAAMAARVPRRFDDAEGVGALLSPGDGVHAPPGGGGGGIQFDPAPPALLAGADCHAAPPLPVSSVLLAGADGHAAWPPPASAGTAGADCHAVPPLPGSSVLLAGAVGHAAWPPPASAGAAGADGQIAPLLCASADAEGTHVPPPGNGTHPDCCSLDSVTVAP